MKGGGDQKGARPLFFGGVRGISHILVERAIRRKGNFKKGRREIQPRSKKYSNAGREGTVRLRKLEGSRLLNLG